MLIAIWLSGGLLGFWLARWDVPLVGAAVILAGTLLYWSARLIEKNLDANISEYEGFAQGLRGEHLTAWLLSRLSDEWHVFNSVQLRKRQDFDHILVGPRGIFYIQTKNWRGHLTRQFDGLLRNGRPVTEIAGVVRQAAELKDRLSAETGTPVRWVDAILVSPFAWVDVKGAINYVTVLTGNDLINYIERQSEKLDRAQVNAYVEALTRIAAMPTPAKDNRTAA